MRIPTILLAALLPLLASAVALPESSDCATGPIPTTTTTKTVYNDKRTATSDCSIPTTTITKTVYNDKRNPTSTSSAPAAKFTVKVGGLQGNVIGGTPILKYDPEFIDGAKVGDVVAFQFLANNHTVTQADFAAPCVPKAGAFDTGFMPNTANTLGAVTSFFTVKDTNPAWFYCAQPGNGKPHCQAGMVFAINPPKSGDKTLDAFRSAAALVPVPSSTPATATTTTPSVARATYMVKVGGRGDDGKPILKYDPETVNAKAGDIVKFNFLLANHTVTQSSFDTPCTGIDGGFKTGIQSNPGNVDGLFIKEFIVVDDKPVWFYCGFGAHCQAGMVFSINPGNKFDEFKSKAKASPPKNATGGSGGNGGSNATITEPVTHIVIVGGLSNDGKTPMLRYMPDNVIAKPGDKILFDFKAANHTVTQSSFEQPCQALDGGFKSGVRMNPTDITGLSTFQIDVKDDKPIWVYCGVGTHCQKGMVFAVNAGNKLSDFQTAAKNSAPRSS
ncbi:uncharacterized protein LAJ45_02260 [Morchella importuna]|uniref:uncharacterized protein n=1 Tax=Morchella importuna TaxID=1174673 RepID=UPI001E8D2723|nr:uncharacterized protein LAJ45_02260 [Morchella importuna]KAH8153447.1 hypothetical protein LAJ45_02260 [Morchella importuna]